MRIPHPPLPMPANRRRGIATLEFAMALPVLLLLMVAITWLGFSVIGESEVLIVARNNTWKQRFDDKAKRPLMFPSGLSVVKNPLYPGDADYVTETATKPVHVSPVFDHLPAPTASHTILAGSWDHRAMPLSKFPEWGLMATAGANGIGGSAQNFLRGLSSAGDQLKNIGSQFLSNNAQQIAGLQSGGSSSKGASDAANGAKQASAQNQAVDKAKFQKRLDELGGRVSGNQVVVTRDGGPLDLAIKEINRLQGDVDSQDKAPASKDPEQEKKRKADLDNNKRDLVLAKGKRQRIESDIRDADAELNSAG